MATARIREVTTQATLEEKKKLRKGFRLFDMIFFTLTAIIGLNTLSFFTAHGGQAFTWLLISTVTFFFPYGLLTAELGSTFTQEGGVYEWCKLAGGRLFAAFATMLYWICIPLWIGGILSVGTISAIKVLWFGSLKYQFGGSSTTDAVIEILIALAFIWATTWCSNLPLKAGKRLSIVGAYIKLALLALFVLLALLFLVNGQATGHHIIGDVLDFLPTTRAHVLDTILPLIPLLWIGLELQNGAAEEMDHPQRDVPRSLLWAGLTTVIAYLLFLVLTIVALPENQIGGMTSFFIAYQDVAHALPAQLATALGWLVALGFVVALVSSGSTWLIGVNRTFAMSALDRNAPLALGRFSEKNGTPFALNILSGSIASAIMVIAILISAFAGLNIQGLFFLSLGFVVTTMLFAYLLIFPTFLVLRYKYPTVPRPFRVPGGMLGAWVVTLLPMIYMLIACALTLYPTNYYLNSFPIDRLTYELTQWIPLVVILLLTPLFYYWGNRETRNQDVVVEQPVPGSAEFSAGAGQ